MGQGKIFFLSSIKSLILNFGLDIKSPMNSFANDLIASVMAHLARPNSAPFRIEFGTFCNRKDIKRRNLCNTLRSPSLLMSISIDFPGLCTFKG